MISLQCSKSANDEPFILGCGGVEVNNDQINIIQHPNISMDMITELKGSEKLD